MTASLSHRGPDHQATWVDGAAALGHRRLAIVDLSARGNQPMASADARYVIVFNGEIYNFLELKAELEGKGERFASTSDTEVILALFRAHGPSCFRRLNGMFAIAVWDREERTLFLARDCFGQKPLYIHESQGTMVFASEIKGLLASGRVGREIDPAGLHEYAYFGNALGERTLFRGVRRLEAGCWVRFDRSGSRVTRFWRVEDVHPVEDDVETATRRVRELLDAAVRRHLIADVPVGVFLSGGIDSSALTLYAARHARLASYSVSFDFDAGELPKARRVAELAGTEHHTLSVRGANIADVIRALVRHHDQPFGDAANVPLYLLAHQLEGRIKVVLGGDGGDEVFAGYRRYNVLSFLAAWQAVARGRAALEWLPLGPRRQRFRRFLAAVGEADPALRMGLLLSEDARVPPPTRLLGQALRAQVMGSDPFARYRELERRLRHLEPVQQMLHTDASILLPDIFCEKVDRSTMAHGLEVRLPFLDADLAEYVLGLPANVKVRHLSKKWLLRRALRGIVPREILDAPKRGFGVPYGAWLRGPLLALLREALLEGKATRDAVLDASACRAAIEAHAERRLDLGFLLYKFLNFALWYEAYF